MSRQEQSRFLIPEERIIQVTRDEFDIAVGPTGLDQDEKDWLDEIKGHVISDRLSSYELTQIMPDRVFEDVAQDVRDRYAESGLSDGIVPFKMYGDLVGFHRNGWIYQAHDNKEKDLAKARLAHEAIIALDILVYGVTHRGEASVSLIGDSIKILGGLYLKRYEMLAERSGDEARLAQEKKRFKKRTSDWPIDVLALSDLFSAFDKDNESYAKLF